MSEILIDEFDDFAEGWTTLADFSAHVRVSFDPLFTDEMVARYLNEQLDEYFVKKTDGTVISYAQKDDLDDDDPFFAPPVPVVDVLNVRVTVVSPKQVRIRLG